jgi:hypothetical protein
MEPQALLPTSPLLNGILEISDRTSVFQSFYSLTFEFTLSPSEHPNSHVPAKIIVLNFPDYQWFQKNGTYTKTDALIPFLSIDDIMQSQSAFLVGILGNHVFIHRNIIEA